jgi:predicted AAA+ superfamily ATPase
VLGTCADVYLREEIQAESAARDIGSYARFLDVMAVASGQWLNYSKLASDSEIPKETIRRYVQVLEDTMVAVRIPAFAPGVPGRRRVRQRVRVLLFDVEVRNALLGTHRRPVTPDQLGSVFEQWVVLQAVYINNALRKGWTLSAYRSDGGAEVDLVVSTPDATIGIEVKASRNVSPRDARGLRSLAEVADAARPFRRWIVYRGEQRQRLEDGTEVWPVVDALKALAEVPAS